VRKRRDEQRVESAYTTRAQTEFRGSNSRRLAWAALAAASILILLALLGPDREAVKQRFEYYGKPGELKIMPEVSIDEGSDQVHQLPKSLQRPPPPAFENQENEDLDPKAKEVVPVPSKEDPRKVLDPAQQVDPSAEVASQEQVELRLPSQSNPDWYILKQVNPEYPLSASEIERRTPIIFVRAAIFVGPDGMVLEKMVLGTNGSPVFAREVLAALDKWVFGWRVPQEQGRWIEMTWNFKSPYFSVTPSSG